MSSFRQIVLALALTVGASASLISNVTEHQRYAFDEFKTSFGKHYATAAEDAKRFDIFVENLKVADSRNVAELAAGGSAVHGVTKFSDFTQDEFNAMMLGSKPTGEEKHNLVTPEPVGASINVNWAGTYTTPVKNQGYCGSCWAFSATEQIESDSMRTLGDDYILSPAQITGCANLAQGCNGGWTEVAYKYVTNAGGIVQESTDPYPEKTSELGIDPTCPTKLTDQVVTVDDYYTLSSETAMASYMSSTGPISVCLDAESWNSYTGGVMSICGNSVDHCVQAVGLNQEASTPYWIVRNSWGTSWGESGYIYLKYGTNTCDITNDPTYTSVSNV